MTDKRCPQCGLWNLGSAQHCDCGYDFEQGTVEDTFNKLRLRPLLPGLWGILSILLPLISALGSYIGWSLLSAVTPIAYPAGILILYCISPATLLAGLILSIIELIKKGSNKILPVLGIIIILLVSANLLFHWILLLMVGEPFNCFENLLACFN